MEMAHTLRAARIKGRPLADPNHQGQTQNLALS